MSEVTMKSAQLLSAVKCKISVDWSPLVFQEIVFFIQWMAPWPLANITSFYGTVQSVVLIFFVESKVGMSFFDKANDMLLTILNSFEQDLYNNCTDGFTLSSNSRDCSVGNGLH